MGRPVGMHRDGMVNRGDRERAHRDGMVRGGQRLVLDGMVRDGMVRAERVNRAGRVLVRGETAPGAQVYREVFPG